MAVFEIVDYCGNIIEYVSANNERQALCIYMMNHEELIDVMLWKTPTGMYKLAEYDNEDFYLFARKAR